LINFKAVKLENTNWPTDKDSLGEKHAVAGAKFSEWERVGQKRIGALGDAELKEKKLTKYIDPSDDPELRAPSAKSEDPRKAPTRRRQYNMSW
jgi:hypothetical protein